MLTTNHLVQGSLAALLSCLAAPSFALFLGPDEGDPPSGGPHNSEDGKDIDPPTWDVTDEDLKHGDRSFRTPKENKNSVFDSMRNNPVDEKKVADPDSNNADTEGEPTSPTPDPGTQAFDDLGGNDNYDPAEIKAAMTCLFGGIAPDDIRFENPLEVACKFVDLLECGAIEYVVWTGGSNPSTDLTEEEWVKNNPGGASAQDVVGDDSGKTLGHSDYNTLTMRHMSSAAKDVVAVLFLHEMRMLCTQRNPGIAPDQPINPGTQGAADQFYVLPAKAYNPFCGTGVRGYQDPIDGVASDPGARTPTPSECAPRYGCEYMARDLALLIIAANAVDYEAEFPSMAGQSESERQKRISRAKAYTARLFNSALIAALNGTDHAPGIEDLQVAPAVKDKILKYWRLYQNLAPNGSEKPVMPPALECWRKGFKAKKIELVLDCVFAAPVPND
jgi:hypothetical protein